MKNARINWILTVLMVSSGGTLFTHAAAGEIKDGYPSKALFQDVREQAAQFVLTERSDIRLLFCTRPVLKDRISRSVCVVDDVRITLSRSGRASAREIQIDPAVQVGDLLKRIGLEKWKGNQPQLRVVKRDAIIQSSLISDTGANSNVESFLGQKLEPGDFLIITPKS